MKICFEISCRECSCAFQINSLKFRDRESLECPNCRQKFPQHEYQQLKQALSGIGSISESCAESSQDKGFDIVIRSVENENEKLPF